MSRPIGSKASRQETVSTGESAFNMDPERKAQLECRMTHHPKSGTCKHCAIVIHDEAYVFEIGDAVVHDSVPDWLEEFCMQNITPEQLAEALANE